MSVAAAERRTTGGRKRRANGAAAAEAPAATPLDGGPSLAAAFESFARASASLEGAYGALRVRVEELSLRLRETEGKLHESLEENQRLQESAARRTRLEAMGRMAAEIAHELRNPLGGLELTASLLRDDLAGDPRRLELAVAILDGIRALTRVTGNLLSFTRSVTPRLRELDAASCLERTRESAEAACSARGVALDCRLRGDGRFRADPELLQQILLNLVQNALEATPAGGAIVLGGETRPDGRVELRVEDDGCGMEPETLARVFDPFFTTRPDGTGLGLPISFRLAEAQEGRIEIASERGRGTVVRVSFPPVAGAPAPPREDE